MSVRSTCSCIYCMCVTQFFHIHCMVSAFKIYVPIAGVSNQGITGCKQCLITSLIFDTYFHLKLFSSTLLLNLPFRLCQRNRKINFR